MLSPDKFELLIGSSESSILDFKRSFYKFSTETNGEETAKLVKDVVSFCNTIRQMTAYIIIGIEDKEGNKTHFGLDVHIDDSVLQDKVKDKTFPIPVFHYYEVEYKNKQYGVIEFPIIKYEMPLLVKRKIPGMELDVIYHRRGTMNAAANSFEAIKINDWLRSLPGLSKSTSQFTAIDLIKRLTIGAEKLSVLFADMYKHARESCNDALVEFCELNLRGINTNVSENPSEINYRIHNVMISLVEVRINQPFGRTITQNDIKREMKKDCDHFKDVDFLFPQSLTKIETFLSSNSNRLSYLTQPANTIFNDAKSNELLYVYIFQDEWEMVYSKIRQEAIDRLLID